MSSLDKRSVLLYNPKLSLWGFCATSRGDLARSYPCEAFHVGDLEFRAVLEGVGGGCQDWSTRLQDAGVRVLAPGEGRGHAPRARPDRGELLEPGYLLRQPGQPGPDRLPAGGQRRSGERADLRDDDRGRGTAAPVRVHRRRLPRHRGQAQQAGPQEPAPGVVLGSGRRRYTRATNKGVQECVIKGNLRRKYLDDATQKQLYKKAVFVFKKPPYKL